MGRETAIDQLSAEDRKLLDDKLFANGFNGYVDLASWLQSLGYQISKSSVHRYGQKLERKLQSLKSATQMAIYMQEQLGDDTGALGGMTINMMQAQAYEAMYALDELKEDSDPTNRLLLIAKISKSMGELTRAGITHKKWENEVKEKAREELLTEQAEKLDKHAKAGGLGAEQVDFWRREFLGVRG